MIVSGIPFVHAAGDYTDSDGRHYGIAIHATDNTATDEGEASYASHRTDGTSAHFYCDADSVTQGLDTSRKAGHAGSWTGNENAIAVEITGQDGDSRDWWLANVAWDELGRVLATVIRHDLPGFQVRRASVAEMKANPTVAAFYGHDDMRQAWAGTDHTDPGPNFPWDRLFAAVNAALGNGGTPVGVTPATIAPGAAFPLTGDNVYGDVNGPNNVHGGYYAAEQPIVAAIQVAVGAGVDGVFGPDTINHVKSFQAAHGLPQTGQVDAATWAALFPAPAAPAPQPQPAPAPAPAPQPAPVDVAALAAALKPVIEAAVNEALAGLIAKLRVSISA